MIVFPVLPCRNHGVSGINHRELFSAAECDRIKDSAKSGSWVEGEVGGHAPGAAGTVMRRTRICREQRLPVDSGSGFPLGKIGYEISRANSELWRFDLAGFVGDDPPALLRYDGADEDGGHYDWHVDIGRGANASRKLGFTIQLSPPGEYEGGDLEFHNVGIEPASLRARGVMITFPAYWLHRVTPVRRGTRDVIVGWVHGPSFR